MKNLGSSNFGVGILALLLATGCGHWAQVDRALVNKPAMSLNTPPLARNQSTLSNQKSSSGVAIGACTVCAH